MLFNLQEKFESRVQLGGQIFDAFFSATKISLGYTGYTEHNLQSSQHWPNSVPITLNRSFNTTFNKNSIRKAERFENPLHRTKTFPITYAFYLSKY